MAGRLEGPMRPRRRGGARRVAERRADARMLATAGAVERLLLDGHVPPEVPLVVEIRHRVVRRDPP